jgi:hypothetical protein
MASQRQNPNIARTKEEIKHFEQTGATGLANQARRILARQEAGDKQAKDGKK